MQLDPATLLVTQLLGSSLSMVVLFLAARAHPSNASLWHGTVAMAGIVLSSVLLAGRNAMPPLFSVLLANWVVYTTAALANQAFRTVEGPNRWNRWVIGVAVVSAIVFGGVYGMGGGLPARSLVTSLALALIYGETARELFTSKSRRSEPGRLFAGGMMAFGSLSLLLRCGLILYSGPEEDDLLHPGWDRALAFLPGIPLATGTGLVLLLMHQAGIAEQAKMLAAHDPLTSVPNRRALQDRLDRILSDSSRQAPFSMLLLDIDHFKQINDRHGHGVGDEVLCHFASVLMAELRTDDFFARIGGEEFCMLLPATGVNDAFPIAERLRRKVEHSPWRPLEGPTVSLTMSIGIASSAQVQCASWDTLQALADRALYAAKTGGRNRVEVATADR